MLPSGEEVAREEREGLELQIAQQRIQDVLRVLGNFSQEREEGKTREAYVKQLKRDLAFYYGYNKFLISQILRLFSPPEAVEFLEANETPRPVTIRCNTLKVQVCHLHCNSLLTFSSHRCAAAIWRSVSFRAV